MVAEQLGALGHGAAAVDNGYHAVLVIATEKIMQWK